MADKESPKFLVECLLHWVHDRLEELEDGNASANDICDQLPDLIPLLKELSSKV